jgi:hypothetical protein
VWIDCLLLSLAIFLAYAQVATHSFIEYDDATYIYANPRVTEGFSWANVWWALTNTDAANWHPLTWLSIFLDRSWLGAHTGGYIMMNVIWHIGTSCLCYLAFRSVTSRRFWALTLAVVLALHPVNVENVAWYSERKSLVQAFFWFAGILAYFRFLRTGRRLDYGWLLIAHILGLMAKPMQVTFPCALVLLHVLHDALKAGARESWSTRSVQSALASARLVWPLLVLSLLAAFITAKAQTIAINPLEYLSIEQRIINITRSYVTYIGMTFSPGELAPFYPLFKEELTWRAFALASSILVGITIGLWALRRIELCLGWLWFLGTMVPVIGLVQVGSQSHADRYLYIPMLGLCFLYPTLFDMLRILSARFILAGKLIWLTGMTAAMLIACHLQVSYWRNGVELFRHSLAVTGDCVTTVNCLSLAYLRNNRFEEAIRFSEDKLKIATQQETIAKLTGAKAHAQYCIGLYKEAIVNGKRALDLGERTPLILWVLAVSHLAIDEQSEALEFAVAAKSAAMDKKTVGAFKNEAIATDCDHIISLIQEANAEHTTR